MKTRLHRFEEMGYEELKRRHFRRYIPYFNRVELEFEEAHQSKKDSVMLAITTPAGTVLHTGDFKVDYTPIDGKCPDGQDRIGK